MRTFIVLLFMMTLCSTLFAIEVPSIQTGKALFESNSLGTSGRSCADCHQLGKGLDDSIYLDETELIKLINVCIRKPLAGEPLDPASTEMDSLVLYIRSIYPEME